MALYGALAEAVRRGEAVVRGEVALDASNPTPVVTGLRTITAVALALKGTAAPEAMGRRLFSGCARSASRSMTSLTR